jgi:hypothetical protein
MQNSSAWRPDRCSSWPRVQQGAGNAASGRLQHRDAVFHQVLLPLPRIEAAGVFGAMDRDRGYPLLESVKTELR